MQLGYVDDNFYFIECENCKVEIWNELAEKMFEKTSEFSKEEYHQITKKRDELFWENVYKLHDIKKPTEIGERIQIKDSDVVDNIFKVKKYLVIYNDIANHIMLTRVGRIGTPHEDLCTECYEKFRYYWKNRWWQRIYEFMIEKNGEVSRSMGRIDYSDFLAVGVSRVSIKKILKIAKEEINRRNK